MRGLMMNTPLTIAGILRFAARQHAGVEVVSVTAHAPRVRHTFREIFGRAAQLAHALVRAGLRRGDRVATLAWNDHRHLELYYAVSCLGGVLHTVNPRLFPEQIRYILTHAGDRFVFVDPLLVPLAEKLAPGLPEVERYVVLTDAAHAPQTALRAAVDHESLIAREPTDYDWPELEETTASALCYTSGTTGNPKGVLYDHRSTVLHAYASALPDAMGLGRAETVLAVVPMFHANAWGLPYSGVMTGTRLVLPGPKMGDGATLAALIREERVTLAAGVPTVWQALLAHARESGVRLEPLKRVLVGGSACPLAVMEEFRDRHGVGTLHAWGMTEMSPLGTVNALEPAVAALPREEQDRRRVKQGRAIFGVEMKLVDDAERELPWDGRSAGALKVRGPWVCADYYRHEGEGRAHDASGWFATGDVATIDADGVLQITDRTKDVIKSGGEWISSIDLENVASGHPDVAQAAVIGVRHPKWDERPLLVVVPRPGAAPTREALLAWLEGKVAKWWLPDDVVLVDALPLTATGKISKLELRQRFADYRLPGT